MDGTLIEAWASHKSFRPKDGGEPPSANGREVDFHGKKRSNETHQSTSDPDARLYKKSKGSEAKMSYLGHALMENRHGLLVDTMVTLADGTAERDAALLMASQIAGVKQVTLGADKNYDTQELVRDLRGMKVTPHVAQNNTNRRSAIDGRTTEHASYAISQKKRKRIRELRLDEDHRHAEESEVARSAESELAVHVRRGGLQPISLATAAGSSDCLKDTLRKQP